MSTPNLKNMDLRYQRTCTFQCQQTFTKFRILEIPEFQVLNEECSISKVYVDIPKPETVQAPGVPHKGYPACEILAYYTHNSLSTWATTLRSHAKASHQLGGIILEGGESPGPNSRSL